MGLKVISWALALRRCFPGGQAPRTEDLLGRLRKSDEALRLIAREAADAAGARRVFLVVDQFEELFTQAADDDGPRLTRWAYQRIGRIEGALTRRAEEEFAKLDDVKKETLRKMFVLCLVKTGEGTEDTRRRATREELLAVGEDPRIAESLLPQWTDARLLTTHGEEAQLVDVAHEALIRKWGRLGTWMAEDREEARTVDILRQGAKEWQREGRRPDYLFHGARLAQAKELLASHGRDLTELERSFVATARARALRKLRLIAAVVVLVLAGASYLVYYLNQSRNAADQSKNTAERRLARNYWAESQTARSQGNLLLSLHFIAEAITINPDATLRDSQLIDASEPRSKKHRTGTLAPDQERVGTQSPLPLQSLPVSAIQPLAPLPHRGGGEDPSS